MNDLSKPLDDLEPCQQQPVSSRRVHLTNAFIEFKKEKTEQSIPDRFEQQVRKCSDRLAVKTTNYELTYDALNEAANRVARAILAQHETREEPIALLLEHDAPLIAAILGVLKAGKAYVPLDPSFPYARNAYLLEDSQAGLIITSNKNFSLANSLTKNRHQLINIDAIDPRLSTENLGLSISPDNLAYILYTSGSTGEPKGVIQNHRNVLYVIMRYTNGLQIGADDRLSLLPSCSVTASVSNIFGALLNGASLFPFDVKEEGVAQLADWLIEQEITIYRSVPTVFRHFVDTLNGGEKFPKLRLIRLGGEQIHKKDIELYKRHFSPDCIFVNGYGTSEMSNVWQDCIDKDTQITGDMVPIGYPLEGTEFLLLDEAGEKVGFNHIGEIAIKSRYLSPGYWRKPELTRAAFLPDPQGGSERIYHTGDLGYMLPDGRLVHIGRKDFQVKIRGYRIELGEVEEVLSQHPGVQESVVLAREDEPGEKRLAAYLVTAQEPAPTISELRSFLKGRLPEYMVPSAFVLLDELPLTPNGKLDRGALPAPDHMRPELEEAFVAPRTPVEEVVAGILANVLGLEQVGSHDNFFELGGHSLSATQVISRLQEALQVELPLRTFFEVPTVAGLAKKIEMEHRVEQDVQSPPLLPVSRDRKLSLSFAQQRLWFLDQLEPGSTAYNMSFPMRLRGELDVQALQQSVDRLVERHESLRTTFSIEDGKPVQVIAPELRVVVEVEAVDSEETLEERLKALCAEPFDLATGPLLRVRVLRLSGTEQVLLLMMHHIVSDGWSKGVLFRELAALYQGYRKGEEVSLPELRVQYADYAVWQREWLQGEELERQVGYWRRHLAGAPPVLELPTDWPRPAVQSYRGASYAQVLSAELTERLKSLGRSKNATLFMVMLAAFQVLLARCTGQEDLVVGTPIAGRQHSEIEGLIGLFLNVLALRTDVAGDPDFVTMLGRVKEAALGAYAHQSLPFEKLVEELNPERDASHAPIVQVMFDLHNEPQTSVALAGVELQPERLASETTKFDLNVHVFEAEGGLCVSFGYRSDLFLERTIERLASAYKCLLESIVERPECRISELALLTDAEQAALAREEQSRRPQNAFDVFPAPEQADSLVSRFESQVLAHENRPAVKTPDTAWTYGQLNARANGVAHALLALCGRDARRIGLVFHQDAPMLAGLLGVLKAGQAYVPLDPSYPLARLKAMMADAKIEVVVTEPEHRELVAQLVAPERRIDVMALETSSENPGVAIDPQGLAYILYTSGSTGKPKGVIQTHRNVLHHVGTYSNALHIDKGDRLTLLSACGFDAAVQDIFGALLNGATVYPLDLQREARVGVVLEQISAEKMTILHCTPTVYRYLLLSRGDRDLSNLRAVVLGGEEARPADLELFKAVFDRGAVFVNGLGLTESTVALQFFATHDTHLLGNVLPVGRAVVGTEVMLLDEGGQVGGIRGEIGIHSAYVTPGYWERPELTAAAFLEDPGDEQRIYRTGDMGRRLPDGQLVFMGRIDNQVKIRGFRIELGEIEAGIARHSAIREVVVLAREDAPGDKRLVAYLVAENPPADLVGELRVHLRASLPEYMVPAHFVSLDALPLTPNGKVDRKALPVPDASAELKDAYVAPRTPTEEILAGTWAEVLGVERVGVEDNFFELGGHSLLAMRVVSRVRQALFVELPLRDLFAAPTISRLGARIEALRPGLTVDALTWLASSGRPAGVTGNREEIEL